MRVPLNSPFWPLILHLHPNDEHGVCTPNESLMAAIRSGLTTEHVGEHAVDAALAARSPRAAKYLGWPMLLLLKLAPGV